MSFIEELQAGDKKGLFRSNNEYITYSTGLLPLDYANGFWQEVTVDGVKKTVPVTGITGGTVVTIIGTTGTGKTTLATQMAYNIIRPFEDSTMIFIDTEKTSNRDRIVKLARAKYDDPRIILKKDKTTIEDVLEMFTDICETKEKGGNRYKYRVKGRTFDGSDMMVYVPTVMVIDSLPNFNGKEFNVEDLGNNVDGMRGAKDVTRFFTNVLDRMWTYNITLFIINHVRPKADMNPYAGTPNGLMMLGQGEQLPRGAVAQYYSNTFFRIKVRKSDAYTMDENGFTGYKSTIQLAKSRTNTVGTTFPVAFLGEEGFDSYYTIYEYANSLGLIKGRNPYLYFEGLEEYKFNRKDFRKMLVSMAEFRRGVLTVLKPYLEALLGTKKPVPSTDDVPEGEEQEEEPAPTFGDLSLDEID